MNVGIGDIRMDDKSFEAFYLYMMEREEAHLALRRLLAREVVDGEVLDDNEKWALWGLAKDIWAKERDRYAGVEKLRLEVAQRHHESIVLGILSQPWKVLRRSMGNGEVEEFRLCPGCRRDINKTPHADSCCWYLTAKSCGIA